MAAIKRMLVPIDFSPASDIAFHYAIDLATREGCSIHLLHVIDDTGTAAYPDGYYVDLPGLRAQITEEAERRLKEMAATCASANVKATIEAALGRPFRVIADTASDQGSDLIVMGTHGRGGFAHLVLGSVAERVIRTAPCAVLTVRDTSRTANAVAASQAGVLEA